MIKVVDLVAILVLAKQGALRLDHPVAAFIPAFGRLEVLDPKGGVGLAGIAPRVQDLLRHTAGLAYGNLGDGPANWWWPFIRPLIARRHEGSR